ncbi:MAG: hypothetical protein ACI9LO_001522 [Planctomycetota bacterium]|jgi:hypothetical protein
MKIRKLSLAILLCTFFTSSQALAEAKIDIKYDDQTDSLDLKVKDAYLDDVLSRLSERVGFTFNYDGDYQRIINLNLEGTSKSVILALVKSGSIVLFQSDAAPHKVTRVILLPVGEHSTEMRIREKMPAPRPSGDAEKDRERQERHETRVQRKIMGLGRRADSLLKDDKKNDSKTDELQ